MSVSSPAKVDTKPFSAAESPVPDNAAGDDFASAFLGWSALALVLVVGVPIYVCMPLTFDNFHYDICSRNLLSGGVHYRDTFDNNLPGIVWLQASIRWVVGWSSEAFHVVDMLIFSIIVLLLLGWVRPVTRGWTAAALYAFYLFLPPVCIGQRDTWMFLPAVVGFTLRRRRMERLLNSSPPWAAVAWSAMLEGLCWGAAVWIKPFVFIPGLACWLVSVHQVRRARKGCTRLLIADLGGLLAGGLLAGALGLCWLWVSGSWSYFWEIFLEWNRDYGGFANRVEVRLGNTAIFLLRFMPWSLVLLVATYLGVKVLRRELVGTPLAGTSAASAQACHALLATFLLAWLAQALLLQLPHLYVFTPAVILAMILVSVLYEWGQPSVSRATVRLLTLALLTFVWVIDFQVTRVLLWERCCREGSTPELRTLLMMQKNSAYAVDSAALAEVAAYLRSQGAGDGDVTCLSGCTHPLYLDLNLEPSTRFPQVEMTCVYFTNHRDIVLAELNASHQRFVVSDLLWTSMTNAEAEETNPSDPLALPSRFPERFAMVYPWYEPVVFRSGRYVVHRVTGPARKFWREDDESYLGEPTNSYTVFFVGNQSFRDLEAARASVAVIDQLYRQSELVGDRAGQHQALQKALTMSEQAHAAGKDREAEVFRIWLRRQLGSE